MDIFSSGQQSAIWYQPDARYAKKRCQPLTFKHWSDEAKGDESCIVADAKTNVSGYVALLPTIMATMSSNIDSSLPRYEPLTGNINNTQTQTLAGLLHAVGTNKRQREGAEDEPHEGQRRQCHNRRKTKRKPDKVPRLPPSSGFYGVSARKKRWSAVITYDSKKHYLGCFDTKQEAALAYDKAARQCGEDKPLNYESIAAAEEAATAAQALEEAAQSLPTAA
jgi:hypothetical protein